MTKPSNSLFLNDFRPNFLFRYVHQIFIRYFLSAIILNAFLRNFIWVTSILFLVLLVTVHRKLLYM